VEAIPVKSEEKYRLLLSLAKTANAQRKFYEVMETICASLQPYVPVDVMGVVAASGDRLMPHELVARGVPRMGAEGWEKETARLLGMTPEKVRTKIGGLMSSPASGIGFVAREKRMDFGVTEERRYPEDEYLVRLGVRSYLRAPLVVRDRLVGVLDLMRVTPNSPAPPFTIAEAEFIAELAGPLATTIANSFAFDEIHELRRRIEMENVRLREDFHEELMFGEIVGSSRPLRSVLDAIQRVAATDSTVLITGETGTGKELIARAIHRRSPRSARPMIKVNCAALPENLVASELFGHERGAFTGALARRLGRFELASKGTIFLDEIGELSPEVQAALLRVLQEGEFERVGGTETLRVDARVIAATNRRLEVEVARGNFRNDLFYRLSVFPIEVPSLRERRDDIAVLVEYFVFRHAQRLGKPIRRIDKASMDLLTAYDWPGNIRELQNLIERAMILADGDRLVIDPSLLASAPPAAASHGELGLKQSLDSQEKEAIEAALAAALGRVSGPGGAAARLGMRPTTLQSKIARYGIDKARYR